MMKNTMNQDSRSFSKLFMSICFLILLAQPMLMLSQMASAAEKKPKPLRLDLHKFWDKHCSECHSESGDFARAFLKVVDGKLQGPLHKDSFKMFLHNHYLVKNQQNGIYEMLLAQASTPPRFKEECSSCHNRASDFVRESLALKNGELHSKKDDSSVATFLQSHQTLKAEDIDFFMSVLTRVAHEVYRP